jgi:ribonuclease Z
MAEAVILGTSSAFPTETRNHPAVYINAGGKHLLFDCGEGTQRQIRIADLKPSIDYIFITHWHGDHSLGVGGILQSLNMMRRSEPVNIIGPSGTTASIKHILNTYKFYSRLPIKTRSLDLKKEMLIADLGQYAIYGINVKHSVKCIGYRLQEKDNINIKTELLNKYKIKPSPLLKSLKEGKDVRYMGKILKAKKFTYLKKGTVLVYLTDLAYEKSLAKFARNADILIIESTFSSTLEEKARDVNHLTVLDALTIAKQADAKKVYLVHTSQRYEDSKTIENEIMKLKKKLKINAEVSIPNDLCRIEF